MGRMRGRPWGPDDRTGGPIDQVFAQVRGVVPRLVVERLRVMRPGDDDNVYFLGDERGLDRVQVDTCPGGRPPFLIEAGERFETSGVAEAFETSGVAEATAAVASWLGPGGVGPGSADADGVGSGSADAGSVDPGSADAGGVGAGGDPA